MSKLNEQTQLNSELNLNLANSSSSSSVSAQNESINSSLINAATLIQSANSVEKHIQFTDNTNNVNSEKLYAFAACDSLLISPNQLAEILLRHQKEREELQKRHLNELYSYLLNQLKYQTSNNDVCKE